jgi:hypothetical protein
MVGCSCRLPSQQTSQVVRDIIFEQCRKHRAIVSIVFITHVNSCKDDSWTIDVFAAK